jgi:hypothetical protein
MRSALFIRFHVRFSSIITLTVMNELGILTKQTLKYHRIKKIGKSFVDLEIYGIIPVFCCWRDYQHIILCQPLIIMKQRNVIG